MRRAAAVWMVIASGAFAGDASPPVVQDVAPPSPPSAVKLGGWIGARFQASIDNRLKTIDEDELLAGFEHRPGRQAWVGEHVGKWMHAAVLSAVATDDRELLAKIDRVCDRLIATQEDDGYLGTYVRDQRFGLFDGADWDVWVHKYCLIGLLADWRWRGTPQSLAAARRIGDLLCETFTGENAKDLVAAGQHVGMAATSVLEPMVLLHRATGEDRYLAFCNRIVARWGEPGGPNLLNDLLAKKPVHRIANGKAYEMLSNLVGLCELHRQVGEPNYLTAVQNAWEDIVAHRLYPTGSGSVGEYWQEDGVFPIGPDAAVAETCVTVTWLQLNLQLHALTGEAKYADEVEKTVYNHLLAAQKPSGDDWCYFTPVSGRRDYRSDMNCCHSSGPRGLALIPTFAVELSGDHVAVNLLDFAEARFRIGDADVKLSADPPETDGSRRTLVVESEQDVEFELSIRRPHGSLFVGFSSFKTSSRHGATFRGTWRDGDSVHVDFRPKFEVQDGAPAGHPSRVVCLSGPFVMTAPRGMFALMPFDAPAHLPRLEPENMRRFCDPPDGIDSAARGADHEVFVRRASDDWRMSLAAFGQESWSREGNVDGGIADVDPATYRVTFDGGAPADGSDWFAVTLRAPARIGRVTYRHGHTFHDGGWFDASKGRPRIEGRTSLDAAWETLAEIESYPPTTGTDAAGMADGQPFEARFVPRDLVAIRVIGAPAGGDVATQAFASCAELEAWPD